MKHITVNLLDYFWKTGIKPIKEKIDNLHKVASSGKYTDLTEKPMALKNPHTLNFTGGVTENYDGSVDKSVGIPSLTNNLLANVPGTALDAVQGKALADELSRINSNLIGLSTLTLITQIESPREATSITVDIGYWRNIYKKLHVNIGFNYGNHAIVDLYPEDNFAIRVVVGLTVTYTSVRIDLPTDHTIKFETDTGIYTNGDKIYVFGVK